MVWSLYSILNIVIHGAQTPKYKNCLCCSSARILSWSLTFILLVGGILQHQLSNDPYSEILPQTAKMFDLGIDKSKQ